VLAQVAPKLITSEKLHLHPVLTHAVRQDPSSPLQMVAPLVEVQWPAGTDEKADRLFNQLYECVSRLGSSALALSVCS
jgi:hypothetical protein